VRERPGDLVIVLRPPKGSDGVVQLRRLLKVAWRGLGLCCVSARRVPAERGKAKGTV
jgi:hypothetical protein